MTNWEKAARELERGLPKPLNKRCCQMLPKILREWSRTDLHDHLTRSQESRAKIRAKIKKVEAVKKGALHLLDALNEVGEDRYAHIVYQMAIAERGGSRVDLRQSEYLARADRLREETEFLAKLGAIAPDKYWSLTPGQRVIAAYRVLQDAAAIYQWLTGTAAERRVSRDGGAETGPFYRFASILWPVVFGRGTAGLPSAMKKWAEGRNKFGERSALIVNIAMRHPEWGIFEP